MLFRIRHHTTYRFSKPVFLEPHLVRLRPRCDSFQKVHGWNLTVTPSPAGRSDGYDAEGNHASALWFDGLHRELEFLSETTVETLKPNPFDYLLTYPGAATLPVSYPVGDEAVLELYRKDHGHDAIAELAAELSRKAGRETLVFLNELSGMIYRDWRVIIRETGDPLAPEETLRLGEASCRDLTMFFVAVCRAVGIASRFTSGYQEGDPDQEQRYMHAWPEVYLPGAGWRGYDPTHGLVVSDRHVALAAAADAANAAPTSGSFRGTGATSVMDVQLTFETGTGS